MGDSPTQADIIDAALADALNWGIKATRADCRVESKPNVQFFREGGDPLGLPTVVRQEPDEWQVTVNGRDTTTGRQRMCMVQAALGPGGLYVKASTGDYDTRA